MKRLLAAAACAAFLAAPGAIPAAAHHGEPVDHAKNVFAASKKKKAKRPKAPKAKGKQERYLRAVPSR